jgi:hypothetical protein
MKKLIAVVLATFIFVTCGNYKKVTTWTSTGFDGYMIETVDEVITKNQFYHFCIVDTLSTDLNEWYPMTFYDDEQNKIDQWLYVKDTDTNKFYILTKEGEDTFRLNIRRIIENRK